MFSYLYFENISILKEKSNNVELTLQQDISTSNTESICYYLEAVPFISCDT